VSNEQVQAICGVACVWSMQRHWRKNGHCQYNHPKIFHLYFFLNDGLPAHHLSLCSFLDECKKVYFFCEKESVEGVTFQIFTSFFLMPIIQISKAVLMLLRYLV